MGKPLPVFSPSTWMIALIMLFSPMISSAQLEEEDNRVLNQYIVMLKPAHSLDAVLQKFPSLINKEVLSPRMGIFLVERNTTASSEEFLFTLQHNEHIKLAQYNHRVKPRSLIPNDAQFSNQWNMLNTGQNSGTPGADIEATEAWAINHDAVTCAGDSVVIAIIDNAVDLTHEDLHFFTNYNEVPGNSIDDDGNGYIDDVNGWNSYQNNGSVQGIDNHTMACAGIAAAIGDNNVGVAGVCWGAKIMPVRYGTATEAAVVKAYNYVREMRMLYNTTFGTKGAYIVATNSSFGVDRANPSGYPIWCSMYDSMGYIGILSAAATANLGIDVDVEHDMPTECPSNYLITVTNTTNRDIRNPGAAYGKTSIDLGAPGTYFHSTLPGNTYGTDGVGTSFSSPHVAGAVAAMYSAACCGLIDYSYEHPDSAALLIRQYILDGAEWISSLNNITATNGRLNLSRAIQNLKRYNCDSCKFDLRIDKIDISCSNAEDGAMAAVFSPGSFDDFNILWSNGLTAPECLNQPEGFYNVSVTDTSGCRRKFTTELHQPDSVIISTVHIIYPTDTTNGNISIIASANHESLTYSMDGITFQQSNIFSIDSMDSYTVYVKNSTGCIIQQTIIVNEINDMRNPAFSYSVNPNPVNDELNIYCLGFTGQKTLIEVFDVEGRKVFTTTPTTTTCQLSTTNWGNGIYFVQIKAGNISMAKRIVVLH